MPPSLLALVALSAFEVQGSSTCPRPEAVKALLSNLASEEAHVVELENDRGVLHVRLRDRNGAVLGARELEQSSSCEELAEAAAVLVSAWTIEVPAMELPALEPDTPLRDPTPGEAPKTSEAAPPLAFASPKIAATLLSETSIETAISLDDRSGDHDFGFGLSTGIGQRLTRADGLFASYVWWPLDGLGLQGSFHWHVLDDGLTAEAFTANQETSFNPPVLTDLHSPTWAIGFNAIGSVARGPARLLGLVGGASAELYGVLGIGFGEAHRDFITGPFPDFQLVVEHSALVAIGQIGAGLRLYGFREAIALELELRDLVFPDPQGGVTHSLQLQGGLRVALDPAGWRARDLEDRGKRSLQNRLILTPMVASGFFDDFTDTWSVLGSVAYGVLDYFAVETIGGYFFHSDTATRLEIFDQSEVSESVVPTSDWLRWTLGTGVRLHALRGRFVPFGLPFEGDLSFYLAGGVGFGEIPGIFGGTSIVFVGNFGGGLQLALHDSFALTLEVRDFLSTTERPTEVDGVTNGPIGHTVLAALGTSLLLF